MNEVEFGRRIKERRESQQLSQQDVAVALDLDQSRISQIEKGKRKIDAVHELPKLAQALNCSVAWFYNEEPKGKTPATLLFKEFFPEVEFNKHDILRANQFLREALLTFIRYSDLQKKVKPHYLTFATAKGDKSHWADWASEKTPTKSE